MRRSRAPGDDLSDDMRDEISVTVKVHPMWQTPAPADAGNRTTGQWTRVISEGDGIQPSCVLLSGGSDGKSQKHKLNSPRNSSHQNQSNSEQFEAGGGKNCGNNRWRLELTDLLCGIVSLRMT